MRPVLSNGDFYRIFYSPANFTTNGIFIKFNLKSAYLESYFNKIKCSFDLNLNKNVIDFIRNLENDILNIVPAKQKNKVCRIDEQLSQGFIKIFSDDEYKKCLYNDINILLPLDMAQNQINFSTDGHTVTPAATSLTIDASAASDTIDLKTAGASRLLINGSTDVQFTIPINLGTSALTFATTTESISMDTNDMIFDVTADDFFSFDGFGYSFIII